MEGQASSKEGTIEAVGNDATAPETSEDDDNFFREVDRAAFAVAFVDGISDNSIDFRFLWLASNRASQLASNALSKN